MEATGDGQQSSDLERVSQPKRPKVRRRTRAVQLRFDLPIASREVSAQPSEGQPPPPEEGKRPPEEPVPETTRPEAVEHLRELFSDIEEWTGKRYPALEKFIETADVEAQRDFYRLLKAFMMP